MRRPTPGEARFFTALGVLGMIYVAWLTATDMREGREGTAVVRLLVLGAFSWFIYRYSNRRSR